MLLFPPTTGVYEYQFPASGQYYYWSGGTVDEAGGVIMKGVINVQPRESYSGALALTIAGHTADHKPESGASRRKRGWSRNIDQ